MKIWDWVLFIFKIYGMVMWSNLHKITLYKNKHFILTNKVKFDSFMCKSFAKLIQNHVLYVENKWLLKVMACQSKKGKWSKICKLGSHNLTSEGSEEVKNYLILIKNIWIWISYSRSFRWNCQMSAIVRNKKKHFCFVYYNFGIRYIGYAA